MYISIDSRKGEPVGRRGRKARGSFEKDSRVAEGRFERQEDFLRKGHSFGGNGFFDGRRAR